MPPKKPGAKAQAKKEEVVEIPKTDHLPDGKRSLFVGGWSATQTLEALGRTADLRAGDNVYFYPGTYETDGDVVRLPEVSVECVPGLADPNNAEDYPVVISGQFTISGPAPVVEAAEPSAKAEERTDSAKAPSSAANRPESAVTANTDDATAAQPSSSGEGQATNGNKEAPFATPSKWPLINVSHVAFIDGGVNVQQANAVFRDCFFSTGNVLLGLHQYTTVSVTDSVFTNAVKACVYAYPEARGHIVKSRFHGSADASGSAIIVDNAKPVISHCEFGPQLGYGVIFSGSRTDAGCSLSESHFHHIESTALLVTNGAAPTVKTAQVTSAEYYGLRLISAAKGTYNKCSIGAPVHIAAGCVPKMFGNECTHKVVDENSVNAPRLDAVY